MSSYTTIIKLFTDQSEVSALPVGCSIGCTSVNILGPLYTKFKVSIFTTWQWSCGMVMYSVMPVCDSVILSMGEGESRFHLTITHDGLYLTVQVPRYGTSPPSSDIHVWWPMLETCSNFFSWGPIPYQCWHLVATECEVCTVRASRRYTCYWNAFLWKL